MNWIFSARTIIEEQEVVDAIDAANEKYQRLDDVYDALKWRLAREPEASGIQIPDMEGIYTIKTLAWAIEGIPVLQAVYCIKKNEVVILSVRILE